MISSRNVSLLGLGVLLAVLGVVPAAAQDAADEAAGFAFRLTSTSTPSNDTQGMGHNMVGLPSQIGVLYIRGDATVTGSRTLVLPVPEREGPARSHWKGRLVEQELTGTIDVDDSGMATIELDAEPLITWYPLLNFGLPAEMGFELRGTETWRVAFSDGGRRMEVLAIMPGTRVENPAAEVQILFGGTATATEAADTGDDGAIRFPPGRAVGLRDRLGR